MSQSLYIIKYIPRALNFVKKVGDLKLMSGNNTATRISGTVFCSSQYFWNVASWVWFVIGVTGVWFLLFGQMGSVSEEGRYNSKANI